MKITVLLLSLLISFSPTTLLADDENKIGNLLEEVHLFKEEMPQFKNPFVSLLPIKIVDVETEPSPIQIETAAPRVITPPVFIISGLIWNSDRPQAIVDDQVVSVGDFIRGVKIIGINRTGIEFIFEGQIYNTGIQKTDAQTASNLPYYEMPSTIR